MAHGDTNRTRLLRRWIVQLGCRGNYSERQRQYLNVDFISDMKTRMETMIYTYTQSGNRNLNNTNLLCPPALRVMHLLFLSCHSSASITRELQTSQLHFIKVWIKLQLLLVFGSLPRCSSHYCHLLFRRSDWVISSVIKVVHCANAIEQINMRHMSIANRNIIV